MEKGELELLQNFSDYMLYFICFMLYIQHLIFIFFE